MYTHNVFNIAILPILKTACLNSFPVKPSTVLFLIIYDSGQYIYIHREIVCPLNCHFIGPNRKNEQASGKPVFLPKSNWQRLSSGLISRGKKREFMK